MEIPMMAALFFILFFAALLVMLGFRRGAMTLFFLDLICGIALFIHHITETMNIML